MLHLRRAVADVQIRERVGPAPVADEQRVALRVIPPVRRVLADPHLAAIRFLPCPAEMPFEMIVLFVFFPMWIIFVPVSACCQLFVVATE